MTGRARTALIALFERRHHFMFTGAFHRRHQSEHHAGGEGDEQRESQNATIDSEILKKTCERNALDWIYRDEQWNNPMREVQTACTAEQRQQHTLGEKLSNQTRPLRAQSTPQCQLACTRDATGELKICDIRAANEQKK